MHLKCDNQYLNLSGLHFGSMDTGKLRYLALALGSGLLALGGVLGNISPDIFAAGIIAVLGIASADMIKHRNE